MSFLYNNIAVLAIAALVSLMAWLFGDARGDVLVPVLPWVWAIVLELVLCFPQRRHGETTYDARARVWKSFRRSPVFWISLGLFVLLLFPFINNGLCPGCDAALLAQGMKADPHAPGLPFCVNRMDHLCVVMWFAVALLSAVAVHHCLTSVGKRRVLEVLVWNGAAVAALGFIQGATKAPGPFWTTLPDGHSYGMFFATFGYPNMAGDYFTTLFGLSIALWRERCERLRLETKGEDPSEAAARDGRKKRGRFWYRHFFLLPAGIFFFAALNTLSRAAIILVTTLAVLGFLHTLVIQLSRMRKSRRVFVGVWSLLVFGLVIFFSAISLPEKIHREVDTLDSYSMLDRVTGRGQYHTEVATALWKDHKLFGCGGWGYKHFCGQKMQQLGLDPWKKVQSVGGINVHNDYLQFLAEHGLVGFGAMVALVIVLLWPVIRQWRATVRDLRFKKPKECPPKPFAIFALPAPAFIILLTSLATLVHAFGDCPMRSGAVLSLFAVSLASIRGFVPITEETDEPGGSRQRHHHHHHHHSKD